MTDNSGPRPLLVVCALPTEDRALRGADWSGAAARAGVVRTGMGAVRAHRAMARVLTRPDTGTAALVATGFCATTDPAIAPGEVVVADEVWDKAGIVPCPGADAMAAALRGRGLTVHRGAMVSADHVVRGPERTQLRETGAVAVDMECAATVRVAARTNPDRPVAVARVVVDTPVSELFRPATIRNGLRAFRALRAAVPAFLDWQRDAAGTATPETRQEASPSWATRRASI